MEWSHAWVGGTPWVATDSYENSSLCDSRWPTGGHIASKIPIFWPTSIPYMTVTINSKLTIFDMQVA